jgi:hypothetical protein
MIYGDLKEKFRKIVEESHIESEKITIKAFPLTPEEAIGNPSDLDYPLVKGRERLMEASFRGFKGQAFTDLYGNFKGSIKEILNLKMRTNYERAIFISTLNAVLRALGLITNTVHCKNDEPRKCAEKAVEFIKENYGNPKVFLVGFQPRFAEFFSKSFALRITDLDDEQLGKRINGVLVEGEGSTDKNMEWADLLWVTGTTVVNDTIEQFVNTNKPKIFYGTTVSGAAYLLGLKRFCAMSK